MSRMLAIIGAAVAAVLASAPASALVHGKPVHGMSLYGEPKYGADFTHFEYVNPDAPKGGRLTLTNARDQTFDTFHGYALKGTPAQGTEHLYETLAVNGLDEPFTMYCHMCETMLLAEDNSWIEFNLRPQAKFSDGTQVTAEDIVFTFNKLIAEGAPVFRVYYADVDKVEAKSTGTVRFTFKTKENRELPLILGQLPVLPKAYWANRDFGATTLEPPVGTGPYLVDSFEVGRYVAYKRNPNYWGNNLPTTRGTYNFDEIRYEYFRDPTVQFEAFKTGTFDAYREVTARKWANEYNFPAALDGRVIKLQAPDVTPMTTQSYILNLRRPMFQDRRVRQALNLAFDFESLNKNIFQGAYTRLRSYAQNSELEAKGLPSAKELEVLEPLRDKLPPEVFTTEFTQPVTDATGNPRDNLLKARELLAEAGWELKDGKLTNAKTGAPFAFEVLEVNGSPDTVDLPWKQNLERLGITMTIRYVDSSQFFNRLRDFDFDVSNVIYGTSLSPGNEQAEYWGSDAADRTGSSNYSGVKDPAVDAIIAKLINAPDRESLVATYHALDRVLTWNAFRVLTYSFSGERFAYWSKLQHPEKFPLHGVSAGGGEITAFWWMNTAAAAQPAAPGTAAQGPAEDSGTNWPLIIALLAGVVGAGIVFARKKRSS